MLYEQGSCQVHRLCVAWAPQRCAGLPSAHPLAVVQVVSQAYPWLEGYSQEACRGMLPRSTFAARER